jgi:hypothetical protein
MQLSQREVGPDLGVILLEWSLIAQHKLATIASDWLTNLKSFSYFIPFLADFCYLARSGGVL